MDAKFAPKEAKTLPRLSNWIEKEIIERIKPKHRDADFFQNMHATSHWATHLADAHIKVEETYTKIAKDENALYELDEPNN
jgi:hypothetical protein